MGFLGTLWVSQHQVSITASLRIVVDHVLQGPPQTPDLSLEQLVEQEMLSSGSGPRPLRRVSNTLELS